jgi:DNA-binding SARP family transcriptional activator
LRLLLLGPFEAWLDGRQIAKSAWQTRNSLTVLKFLAAERGHFVSADRLIEAAWPERPPDSGRTSLRQSIRAIRRVLGPEMIATETGAYKLNAPRSALAVDVDEFTTAAAAGRHAERRGDRDAAITSYREAIYLYRGEYMADEIYADWVLERREELRIRCLDALEGLARALIQKGAPEEAVPVLEHSLTIEPLREELHAMLIRSHALSGRRSHALAAYERCRRILDIELGVEPSAETMRLRDEVAAQTPLVEGAAPEPRMLAPVFVGREAELTTLERAVANASSEVGHIAVLSGSAGIGKTRLLRQLAGRVRTTWLTANESESDLNYAPLLTHLNAWLQSSASAAQLAGLGPFAAALVDLLPAIRLIWPDCPPAAKPEQSALLEALTRLLLLTTRQQPSLLVVDDLHWADAGTLRWLGYGLGRFPAGLVVVGAARDTEHTPALSALIATARRSDRLTELTIPPLSASDTARLVSAAQPQATTDLADALFEATRGNPLFVVEILRELSRRGEPESNDPPTPLPLPRSVRDAIANRIASLPEHARAALVVAAVHGAPFRAQLIRLALELSEEAVLSGLEVLLETALTGTTDDGQSYVISHPLVRRVAYDELSPGRRQSLHLQLATAVERSSGGPHGPAAPQILRHLEAGGGAPAAIIRAGALAAEYAFAGNAYAAALDALRHVREGLRALPETDRVRDDLRHNSELEADALVGLARWDEALLIFEQLLPGAGDPLEGSRLRRKLAQVLSDTGARSLDRALLVLDDAMEVLEGSTGVEADTERARVGATRTLTHFHRSEFAEAVTEGEGVLELFDGLPGVERDVMEQTFRVASAEQRLGRLEAAAARYPDLLRRARSAGDELAEARFKDAWSVILMHRGQLAEAQARQAEALASYRSSGVPKFEAIGVGNLGYLLDHQGDLRGSVAAYRAAIELAERIGATYTVVHNRVGLGDVLIRRGDVPAARAALESAIELALEIGTRQRLGHAQLHLADVALVEGDVHGALELAAEGLRIGRAIGDGHSERVGNPILSRILRHLGRGEEAIKAARAGLAAARPAFVIDEGRNLVALAQAASGPEAKRSANLAEAIFRAAGARALLAEALAAIGGSAALDEARSLARSTGSGLLLRRIA